MGKQLALVGTPLPAAVCPSQSPQVFLKSKPAVPPPCGHTLQRSRLNPTRNRQTRRGLVTTPPTKESCPVCSSTSERTSVLFSCLDLRPRQPQAFPTLLRDRPQRLQPRKRALPDQVLTALHRVAERQSSPTCTQRISLGGFPRAFPCPRSILSRIRLCSSSSRS